MTIANGEFFFGAGAGAPAGATEKGLRAPFCAAEAGVSLAIANGEAGDPGGASAAELWFANVSKIPRVVLMVGGGSANDLTSPNRNKICIAVMSSY